MRGEVMSYYYELALKQYQENLIKFESSKDIHNEG